MRATAHNTKGDFLWYKPEQKANRIMGEHLKANSLMDGPDKDGRFGNFGGRFVAETLMPLVLELEGAYRDARNDPEFKKQLDDLNANYTGRPSPLYHAERMSEHLGGAKIYFKREELNHTGSHKLNNCLGQILLAKRMGKTRIIAETGAGQHGVATATVCARFGLPCVIYMGETDVKRQAPNVFRMKLLGAQVIPVSAGAGTLKDAMNEALRDWVSNVDDTYYLIGTAAGPHPYPEMVRDFQSIIGFELRDQFEKAEGGVPEAIVACIGGGSNAIGTFYAFLDDEDVSLYGAEAGGHGIEVENGHAASMTGGRPGILHGNRTYLLQDDDGQILEGHSISAGLDYPGVGPQHSFLKDIGRVNYVPITDKEALAAFQLCTKLEGIMPALESAHGLAQVIKLAPNMSKEHSIVLCLSGRGDKDVETVGRYLGVEL
ncbi:Tryptophan synthase beta chain [hydrothermal vent metagenome]|uniref:tryptophan synthase n=1 Tax=hydrothermal vent metagenome TaxID=652676 RepID=A0A3B0U1R0_9ZZZZ